MARSGEGNRRRACGRLRDDGRSPRARRRRLVLQRHRSCAGVGSGDRSATREPACVRSSGLGSTRHAPTDAVGEGRAAPSSPAFRGRLPSGRGSNGLRAHAMSALPRARRRLREVLMGELLAVAGVSCGEPMVPNVSTLDDDGCGWICLSPGCPELAAGELEAGDLAGAGASTSTGTGSGVEDGARAGRTRAPPRASARAGEPGRRRRRPRRPPGRLPRRLGLLTVGEL